jgi:hypothetical protein
MIPLRRSDLSIALRRPGNFRHSVGVTYLLHARENPSGAGNSYGVPTLRLRGVLSRGHSYGVRIFRTPHLPC